MRDGEGETRGHGDAGKKIKDEETKSEDKTLDLLPRPLNLFFD